MAKRIRRKTDRPNLQSRRPAAWLAALLMLAAAAAYVNTLGHKFVYDDATLIVQNTQVTELRWGEMLGPSGYRPMRTLTYAFNFLLGGTDPFGYHLFNVLLHALNVGLVFLLLGRLGKSNALAGAGALLFALHPVQTASVAYVSGRKDLLAAFFVLGGILFYLAWRQRRDGRLLAAVAVSFLLAMLSKEVAIVFPALLYLVDLHLFAALPKTRRKSLWRAASTPFKRLPIVYGSAAALATAAAYYAVFLTKASRMEGFWGGSWAANLGTSFKLFAHYLKLAVYPHPLIADYTGEVFPIARSLFEPAALLSMTLTLAFLGAALWTYRRNSLVSVGMLWFFLTLLPVLQIIPFHELAEDHFLYLPLVGPCLLAGLGVEWLTRRPRFKAAGWAATAAAALLFFVMTVDRNQVWKDEETLWRETYQQAPGSFRANLNLGLFVSRKGDWNEAVRLTRRSLELTRSPALPLANLGTFHRERGVQLLDAGRLAEAERLEREAIDYLERAIHHRPADPVNHSNLADCYKDLALIEDRRGNPEKAFAMRERAVEGYRTALRLGRRSYVYPYLWFKLGMVLFDHGDCGQALYYLEKTVDDLTGFAPSQYFTGYCHFQKGEYEESARYFERTLRIQQSPDLYSLLAVSYERLGDADRAIEVYVRALRRYPQTVEFLFNLGVLHFRKGELQAALGYFQTALQLAPSGELAPRIKEMLGRIDPKQS